jgi:hypothetical protein
MKKSKSETPSSKMDSMKKNVIGDVMKGSKSSGKKGCKK